MFAKSFAITVCLLLTALVTIATAATLQELTANLDSPDPAVRLDAVRRIAMEHFGEGWQSFDKAAKDPDEYVRERAIQALGQYNHFRSSGPVMDALDDPADFVRWRAVQAVKQLGIGNATEGFLALLEKRTEDPFWRVRVVTFQLLGEIAGAKLRSSSPELVNNSGGAEIRELMLVGLDDSDERARVAAARALAVVHDSAAYAPLVDLLGKGSLFTREEAALGLGELGDPRAVPVLIEALEDPRNSAEREGSDWARWGAAVALHQLTGQDFQIDVKKWRAWLANNSR